MIKIQVEINDAEIRWVLQRLIDAGINPHPALLEIGEEVVDSTITHQQEILTKLLNVDE